MNGNLRPFQRAALPIKPKEFIEDLMKNYGATRADAKIALRKILADEVWLNDEYQVNVDKNPPHGFPGVTLWHLSVKRVDRAPIHDWRDLQAIKNALCGEEAEAVELYPAESRLVDGANQFHLWAFLADESGSLPRLPFGWAARSVSNASEHGTVQRPREAA